MPIHTAHPGFDQIAATLQLTSLSDGEHGHFIFGDLELAQVEFMATQSFFQWEITTAGGRDDSAVERAVLHHGGLQRALQDFCGLTLGSPKTSSSDTLWGSTQDYSCSIQGHRLCLTLRGPWLPATTTLPVLLKVFQQLIEASTHNALPWEPLCQRCRHQPGQLRQRLGAIVLQLSRLCPECSQTNPGQTLVERVDASTQAPPVRQLDPTNPVSLFAAAEALWEKDAWEQALQFCQQALSLDPSHRRAQELASQAREYLDFERIDIPPQAAWLT